MNTITSASTTKDGYNVNLLNDKQTGAIALDRRVYPALAAYITTSDIWNKISEDDLKTIITIIENPKQEDGNKTDKLKALLWTIKKLVPDFSAAALVPKSKWQTPSQVNDTLNLSLHPSLIEEMIAQQFSLYSINQARSWSLVALMQKWSPAAIYLDKPHSLQIGKILPYQKSAAINIMMLLLLENELDQNKK